MNAAFRFTKISRGTLVLTLLFVIFVIGCKSVEQPPEEHVSSPPRLPLVSGQQHNLVLTLYQELATDKDASGLDKQALVRAWEAVADIPDTLSLDRLITSIETAYRIDCLSGFGFSDIGDSIQQRWLTSLLPDLMSAHNAAGISEAIRRHTQRYGRPSTEPLLSFVDIALGSAEYHHSMVKKWSSVVIVADAVGVLRGLVLPVPAPMGALIGLFYSTAYSIMANEAIPPDG